jgi:hypothetical protein
MASPSLPLRGIWLNRTDVMNAVNAATNLQQAKDAVSNCCPTRMVTIDPGPPVAVTIATNNGSGQPVSITLTL